MGVTAWMTATSAGTTGTEGGNVFQHDRKEKNHMRAEPTALKEQIEQSIGLLRRHL